MWRVLRTASEEKEFPWLAHLCAPCSRPRLWREERVAQEDCLTVSSGGKGLASSQAWHSFRRQEGVGRNKMGSHLITRMWCRFDLSLNTKERICWCFFLEKLLSRNFSVPHILARMASTCFLETIPSTRKSWCFIVTLLEMTVFKSRTLSICI